MKIQYRLIKEYPGSLKLGSIASTKDGDDLWKGRIYYDKYPEYWEEVIEKDYEIRISKVVPYTILSVKRLSDGEIFTVGDKVEGGIILGIHIDKFYTGGLAFSLDTAKVESLCSIEKVIEKDYEILSQSIGIKLADPQKGYEVVKSTTPIIHSVKRLSDGEVFTVGDLITGYSYEDARSIQTIKICCYTGIIKLEQILGYTDLRDATKAKQPFFATCNGKDIFEGDEVWYVNKENFYYDYFIAKRNVSFFSDINVYFLTRVEAEEYIKKNKVLFTTEDGVDIKEGDTYYLVDTDFSIHTMKAHSGAGQYSERKYFSTVEEAHEYVMQNVKALSIKDFWEITCMSTSISNKSTYMRGLVKKTLGLK